MSGDLPTLDDLHRAVALHLAATGTKSLAFPIPHRARFLEIHRPLWLAYYAGHKAELGAYADEAALLAFMESHL